MKKIAYWYLKIVETICILLLLLIMCCMFIQVFCRTLSIGQNFTEELARIAFIFLVFICAPLTMAEGADIAVDMVVKALPKPVQKIVEIVVDAFAALFGILCVRSLITYTSVNTGVTAISMTWLKMNWLYYAMMVSFTCLTIVAVVKAVALISGHNDTIDINEAEKLAAKEEEVDLGI